MQTPAAVSSLVYGLVACVLLSGTPGVVPALYGQDVALTIRVIDGEDGVNIIKKKTAVKPVVEVRDKNDLPVAGALVLFTTPSSGASATFAKGARSLSVVTNSAGRAAVPSLQPVEPGAFNIGVSASYNGQVASTTIAQTNFATTQAAQAAGALPASIGGGAGGGLSAGVIGAIAAGAGVATLVIVKSVGGDDNKGPGPSATIGIGNPTLGAPR
jgi:hypothetical protein